MFSEITSLDFVVRITISFVFIFGMVKLWREFANKVGERFGFGNFIVGLFTKKKNDND